MEGIEVSVCNSDTKRCSFCGRAAAPPPAEWEKVECVRNIDLTGNLVRLANPNNTLFICEMKIVGESKLLFIYSLKTKNERKVQWHCSIFP